MAQLKPTQINDTGFLQLPAGTSAQRPSSPQEGMIRYNTDLNQTEYYDGSVWRNIKDFGPKATGGVEYNTLVGGIPYKVHIFSLEIFPGPFAYVSQLPATSLGGSATGPADVKGESDSPLACSGLLTFEQALQFAHAAGFRLPTRDEVIRAAARRSGCGYDNELIWTCDKANADATEHFTIFGRTDTNGTASFATSNTSTAHVRYVADVDVNRTDPVLLDDAVIHQFLAKNYPSHLKSATYDFTVTKSGEVEYLIVAGGGSGGNGYGGGGGAGGVVSGTTTLTPQSYTITVGNGAPSKVVNDNRVTGDNGENSTAFGLTALGGGGGGGQSNPSGLNGGSGGGNAGQAGGNPGVGLQSASASGGFGNNGGAGNGTPGGGGGGAGSVGANSSDSVAGNGGIGISSLITGTAQFFAGGGGGGNTLGTIETQPTSRGLGGLGGGGIGQGRSIFDGTAGIPNTGGGSGGSDGRFFSPSTFPGGSGIVIIRYVNYTTT